MWVTEEEVITDRYRGEQPATGGGSAKKESHFQMQRVYLTSIQQIDSGPQSQSQSEALLQADTSLMSASGSDCSLRR